METGNQENIDDYLRKYEYTAKNLKRNKQWNYNRYFLKILKFFFMWS